MLCVLTFNSCLEKGATRRGTAGGRADAERHSCDAAAFERDVKAEREGDNAERERLRSAGRVAVYRSCQHLIPRVTRASRKPQLDLEEFFGGLPLASGFEIDLSVLFMLLPGLHSCVSG